MARGEIWAGVALAVALLIGVVGGVLAEAYLPDDDMGIWRNCGAVPGHKYLVCGVRQ